MRSLRTKLNDPFLRIEFSFPAGMLVRLESRSFYGSEVLVPERAEEFLTFCDGGWRTPDKTAGPCLNARIIYDPKGL